MGMLTKFFVANVEDAEAIGTSAAEAEELYNVEAKGLDAAKLGTLYSIASFTPYSADFMKNPDHMLYKGASGVQIQLVPSELVISLCQIPDLGLPSVAGQWLATDPFKDSDWTAESVQDALKNFSDVCREALGEGKALMMYIAA
jgi:hypothetical protein